MLRLAFGLTLDSDFPLPGLHRCADPGGAPPVRVELGTPADVDRLWGSASGGLVWKATFPDGDLVTVTQRADGAQRIVFGAHAVFVLDRGRRELICAPTDVDDPRWRRFLLDTVLWWTSAMNGFFLLHCCALDGAAGTVAFASLSGGGKTTLALELLRRQWTLVADDVLALEALDGQVIAHPAPGLMNAPAQTPDLEALGTPLATIGDEVWLEVEQATGAGQRLSAIVLYVRGDDLELQIERRYATPLDLVPHVWDVMGGIPRVRERFNFLGDIVANIPVYTLSAPSLTPPEHIARTIEDAFEMAAPTP